MQKLGQAVAEKKRIVEYKIQNGLPTSYQEKNLDDSIFSDNQESHTSLGKNILSVYLG